jgi:resuscitation-promoting factor RpfA
MSGRHRKPPASGGKVAKVAFASAVLGSSGLGLIGRAAAATGTEWDQVARCESGGDWAIDTGNGYQGGLQFLPTTWKGYGGDDFAESAQLASKEQQIAVAERVLASQGRGAWPVCGGPLSRVTPRNTPVVPSEAASDQPVAPASTVPAKASPDPATDSPASLDVATAVPTALVAPDTAASGGTPDDPASPPAPPRAPDPDPQTAPLPPATDPALPQPDSLPTPGPDPVPSAADGPAPEYDATSNTEMIALVHQVAGTPYISGGDSRAGTDCSGLASWLSNIAAGRPIFGDRFSTHNEESALLARGFSYGTAPGALVIGWNDEHTAATLPDGTSVSSGEGAGVKFGGGGAYEAQFTHHMYLMTGTVHLAAGSIAEPQGPGGDSAGVVESTAEPPTSDTT